MGNNQKVTAAWNVEQLSCWGGECIPPHSDVRSRGWDGVLCWAAWIDVPCSCLHEQSRNVAHCRRHIFSQIWSTARTMAYLSHRKCTTILWLRPFVFFRSALSFFWFFTLLFSSGAGPRWSEPSLFISCLAVTTFCLLLLLRICLICFFCVWHASCTSTSSWNTRNNYGHILESRVGHLGSSFESLWWTGFRECPGFIFGAFLL